MGASLSLPDPIGTAAATEDPLEQVLNLSPDEVTKLGGAPPLGRHRRCSSDTFYSLLAHLAVPDIELLGESSAPHRRPTVDTVQQDEILRFLRHPETAKGHEDATDAGGSVSGAATGAIAAASAGYGGTPSPSPSSPADARLRSGHLHRSNTISGGMMASTSAVAASLGLGGVGLGGEGGELDAAAQEGKGKGKAKALSGKRKRSKDDAEPDSMQMQRVRGLSLVDEKKAKRILANRISAQKSRLRKLEFIDGLEKSVSSLKAEMEVLKERVETAQKQKDALNQINLGLDQELRKLSKVREAKAKAEAEAGTGITIFRDSL